ncbi:HAD-superfamily hydrolase [Baekduia alba]|uniref:HAD family hydrolase n=1 Tax=Baekduia alba TaxID=2997333 RepID=UPI0023420661|nr:HAD-IA family hydrolase [Baekduia alba]WCB97018.1 HAD-superfamily hydrolase [Baekduia alba]
MKRGAAVRPQAVLLDALGTLVRLEPPVPLLRAELAARGVAVSEDEASRALRTEIAYYRAHHDEAADAAALADLRDRCAEVLRAALPRRARDVADLREALLASLRFTAYPDAAPALRTLRAAGLRLVVVSNWDVSLHEALAATGLEPLVDAALSSAEAGSSKPDGAIFRQALALAGDPAPSAVVHVGDSPEHDVAGALAAGLRPILVARDGAPTPAPVPGVTTVADLTALGPLLAVDAPSSFAPYSPGR